MQRNDMIINKIEYPGIHSKAIRKQMVLTIWISHSIKPITASILQMIGKSVVVFNTIAAGIEEPPIGIKQKAA